MKQKKVENIFYQNYRSEVRAVEKIMHSALTSGHIHRLRVHIKKINAFLLLFDEAAPGQLKITKFRSYFHKLFKAAGKVREIQINQTLADRYKAKAREKSVYKLYSHKKVNRLKKRLNKMLQHFDHKLTKKADHRVNALCATLGDNYILLQSKQFILQQINQIQSISEANGDAGFHQLRKHLKAIHAVACLLNTMQANASLKKKLEQLKKTEQRIGKWHDHLLFDISWADFRKKDHIPAPLQMTLSQHLKKSQTGSKNAIHNLLQKILHQLPDGIPVSPH